MNSPAYPSARRVAAPVNKHFSLSHAAARNLGDGDIAPLPDEGIIETIVDAAFWTSLRREERYPPRISIAFVPPEQSAPALRFEQPLALHADALTRVAPGVERAGIHLGVWSVDGELRVWGATRNLPVLSFVVETIAPGVLVIKHRHTEAAAKFINVAVLEGDQIKILKQDLSEIPGCPSVLQALLGTNYASPTSSESSNVLIRLAVSMREHGRGGTLLVVPHARETWRESIAHPVSYSVHPAYAELATVLRDEPAEGSQRRWRDALRRAVDAVAGLTAVDGATVLADDNQVLAFGAKIIRRDGAAPIEQVAITEPIQGAVPRFVHVGQLGGTRHISAAQFAHDQRDAIALVASQDGPFTIFAWSDCDKTLYGYRVETLLL